MEAEHQRQHLTDDLAEVVGLPDSCRCAKCGHEEPSTYEYKNTVYVVRDLDLWGQPSWLIFQPCFHRCSRCGHRQEHLAPFKRKKVMYTYRFEEYVLRMLIGSNEEEVAARLGISAETVALIVENQLKDDKQIDPARVIKHVGMDEISLLGKTKVIELRDGRIESLELDPSEFGFAGASIDQLGSGDAITNAALIRHILSGKEQGPRRDIVVLNAAAAIIVAGLVNDFQQAIPLAEYSIDDGKAMNCLETLIEVSNKG